MARLSAILAITVAATTVACAPAALADAMQCSGEVKTCIANCAKSGNRALAANCITNCRTFGSLCMRTGCWDDGRRKFCGVMRK